MNPEYVGWDVVVLMGLVSALMLLAYFVGIYIGRQSGAAEMVRMRDAIVDRDRKIVEVEWLADEFGRELMRLWGGVREVEGQQERRVM